MTYQVLYTREDRYQFAPTFRNEVAKDNFVQTLTNAGINYAVTTIADKSFRVCRVVFDIKDVIPAMKDPNYKYAYIFGDPKNYTEKSRLVIAECSSGEKKPVIVIESWMETETKIAARRKKMNAEGKLKNGHICLIVGSVL